MLNAQSITSTPNDDAVLAEATLNAASALGLTQAELARVIGRNRSRLKTSIRVEDKSGELALLLVRIYRSLYALVDGETEQMKHWMRTLNQGTGGVPREQVVSVQGLTRVVTYLDAIRGKI